MTVNSISSADIGKTDRGTRIVKPGQDMDKNSFLKILTAELSNQDPDNTQDSTQYVAQLAQFSSLEQMANLNNTMTLSAASSLVGKTVSLDQFDQNGNRSMGVVQSVNNNNGDVTISVAENNNGIETTQDYDYSDVYQVLDTPDSSDNMNGNLEFLMATSLMGAHVELDSKDSSGNDYSGIVKSVYRDSTNNVKVSVQLDGSSTTKDFTYDDILKING